MTQDIVSTPLDFKKVNIIDQKKPQVSAFGAYLAPEMVIMDYEDGKWQQHQITKTTNFQLSPSLKTLQYAHSIFEGLKAFKHENGELYTFRSVENAKRLNKSARYLDFPTIPVEKQTEILHELLDRVRDFYPTSPESCFYIRPFMMSTDTRLGVSAGDSFRYAIVVSPSGPYYSKPLDALVAQQNFSRVRHGGKGETKAGANYVDNPRYVKIAQSFGAHQVLFGQPHIEEYGTMNHGHITNEGIFQRPVFNGNILKSNTTNTIEQLMKYIGLGTQEIQMSPEEFKDKLQTRERGAIIETFGMGTAAVVAPVKNYIFLDETHHHEEFTKIMNKEISLPSFEKIAVSGSKQNYTNKIKSLYTGIQRGTNKDHRVEHLANQWLEHVPRN